MYPFCLLAYILDLGVNLYRVSQEPAVKICCLRSANMAPLTDVWAQSQQLGSPGRLMSSELALPRHRLNWLALTGGIQADTVALLGWDVVVSFQI